MNETEQTKSVLEYHPGNIDGDASTPNILFKDKEMDQSLENEIIKKQKKKKNTNGGENIYY